RDPRAALLVVQEAGLLEVHLAEAHAGEAGGERVDGRLELRRPATTGLTVVLAEHEDGRRRRVDELFPVFRSHRFERHFCLFRPDGSRLSYCTPSRASRDGVLRFSLRTGRPSSSPRRTAHPTAAPAPCAGP